MVDERARGGGHSFIDETEEERGARYGRPLSSPEMNVFRHRNAGIFSLSPSSFLLCADARSLACLNVGLSVSGPLPPARSKRERESERAVPSRSLPSLHVTSNLIIIIMLHHLAKEEGKTCFLFSPSLPFGIPSLLPPQPWVLICSACKAKNGSERGASFPFWGQSIFSFVLSLFV